MSDNVDDRFFDPDEYQVAARMGGDSKAKERLKVWYSDELCWSLTRPKCKCCGHDLMRWGWYEAPNEPIEYWYCIACDVAGRAPYIFVLPAREKEGRNG